MNTFATAGAPRAVADLYHKHREEMIDTGKKPDVAHGYALRMLRLGGWYRTGSKASDWKQLTPDLRDRVNVREAVKQPDGRYLVDDVDVFYPNAVKAGQGGDTPDIYDADDIRQIIKNTNASIEAGGWRPTLIEGHQHPAADMLGSQFDGHGYGVNWRESPRGDGWARCTLVDIEPEYLARIRDRKLPGLSARISNDAGKLNRRFGHIALLGGTPPALSRLPMLEVFSVSNQVCFSAEPENTPRRPAAKSHLQKGRSMPLNKDKARRMAECFSSLGASYASYAAGEDGADDKMAEAHKQHVPTFQDAMKDPEFGAYLGDLGGGMAGKETQQGNEHADAMPDPDAGEFSTGPHGGSDITELPTKEDLSLNGEATQNRDEFAAHADNPVVASLLQRLDRITEKAGKMATVMSAMSGKMARYEFSSHCENLRKKGYRLPDQKALFPMLEGCYSAADPKSAVKAFYSLLETYPKDESRADFGVTLGLQGQTPVAQSAGSAATPKTYDSIAREISEATGRDFSGDDVKIGEIFSRGMGGL